eukprot:1394551-Amorphochlora_amoeboformis.AAC.1
MPEHERQIFNNLAAKDKERYPMPIFHPSCQSFIPHAHPSSLMSILHPSCPSFIPHVHPSSLMSILHPSCQSFIPHAHPLSSCPSFVPHAHPSSLMPILHPSCPSFIPHAHPSSLMPILYPSCPSFISHAHLSSTPILDPSCPHVQERAGRLRSSEQATRAKPQASNLRKQVQQRSPPRSLKRTKIRYKTRSHVHLHDRLRKGVAAGLVRSWCGWEGVSSVGWGLVQSEFQR